MKQSCRILVGLACNFSCRYCCNKLPNISSNFKKVSFMELTRLLSMYPNVCVSGGEPLLDSLINRTMTVVAYANSCKRNVYLYTNLSCWDKEHVSIEHRRRLAREVTGWNIGYHPSQLTNELLLEKLKNLLSYSPKNVRILSEDIYIDSIQASLDEAKLNIPVKAWVRDECDEVLNKEDLFIWQ